MKALDISGGSEMVTPDWCAARIAEGYRLLIANLWTGRSGFPKAAQALRLWREAGGVSAGYFVVHDFAPLARHFEGARASAGDEWAHMAFVAVDVEQVSNNDPLDQQVSVATVRAACDLVTAAGQRPMVYTSKGMWRALVGDSPALADMPLWDASYALPGYTMPPNLEVEPGYGGWTARTAHQYQDTTDVDGIACDLNVFRDEWVSNVQEVHIAPGGAGPLVPDDVRINAGNVLHGWGELLQTRRVTNPELSQLLAECGEALRAMH